MRIIVNGAKGRMGRCLCDFIENSEADMTVAAKADRFFTDGREGYGSLNDIDTEADCIIDFSSHTATKELLDYAMRKKLPLVIATTGQTAEELLLIAEASKEIPIFLSGNMSLGVALIAELAARAAAFLPNADIEIVEAHHNKKLDVPSGTALMIANSVKSQRHEAFLNIGRHENGLRNKNEIGIHSLRYGSEIGDHKVIISTESEVITLEHKAQNRGLFAEGALTAAGYICTKKNGLFGMREYLNDAT